VASNSHLDAKAVVVILNYAERSLIISKDHAFLSAYVRRTAGHDPATESERGFQVATQASAARYLCKRFVDALLGRWGRQTHHYGL
jgi:hypothetical protein